MLSESCRFLENDVDWRDVGSVDRAQVRVGPACSPSLVDRSGRAVPKCAAVPRFAARLLPADFPPSDSAMALVSLILCPCLALRYVPTHCGAHHGILQALARAMRHPLSSVT